MLFWLEGTMVTMHSNCRSQQSHAVADAVQRVRPSLAAGRVHVIGKHP